MKTSERNLRMALKANSVFSLMSGILLLLFTKDIAELMNIDNHYVLVVVGVGMLLFFVSLIYNSTKIEISTLQVNFIIAQDYAWVIGSIALLVIDLYNISQSGNMIIGIVAIIVMLLGILQTYYLNSYENNH